MKLSLKGRLFLLSGILLAMCAVAGFIGYFVTSKVSESYDRIVEANLPNVRSILTAQGEARSYRMYLYILSTPGINDKMRERAYTRYAENRAAFDREIKHYVSLPFGPGEDELWKKLEPLAKAISEKSDAAVELSKAIKSDADVEARQKYVDFLIKEVNPLATPYAEAIAKIVDYHNEFAAKNAKEARDMRALGVKILIGALALAIIIGFTVAFVMAKQLTDKFREISASLNQSGNEVSSASEQVASSSQELSQAVHEQAASLQETAASLEELTSTIAKNSETSKSAEGVSTKSKNSATHGKEVVGEMLKSMDEINVSNQKIAEQVARSNQEIADIVKVITEIGNKTKVINDIVFQTKLLSFNASVEAARAGENGKGFAVVAEEVGNLAQMSGKAANEISSMLDGSIQKVTSIVRDSQEQINRLLSDGTTKLEKGNSIAKECGEVFNEIFDEISHINVMSSEISQASEEQTKGVQEINSAVNNLDQATQQNASVSQEAAAAAEELSRQAESMRSMVKELIFIVEGNNASSADSFAKKKVVQTSAPVIKHAEPKAKEIEKVAAKAAPKVVEKFASEKKIVETKPVETKPINVKSEKVEPRKEKTSFFGNKKAKTEAAPTPAPAEKKDAKVTANSKIKTSNVASVNEGKPSPRKGELANIPSSDDERFEDVI